MRGCVFKVDGIVRTAVGLTLAACLVLPGSVASGQLYAPPDGGWAYVFQGDAAINGEPDFFASLDGTWDHDNGSDAWDGTGIGEGLPGGVAALTEDGTTFLRVQDTGDPRDTMGISDPSNRKQYFTHRLMDDFTDDTRPDNLATIIDDGVTLYFRTRAATAATGPIDDLNPDGGTDADVAPWPDDGLGYFQHNGGKSMIAIKQAAEGNQPNVALGFARTSNVNPDLFPEGSQGLILPHLLPNNELNNASDPATTPPELSLEFGNVVPVDDLTAWHEFWVTIEAGTTNVDGFEDGTHVVNVYHGSAADPEAAMTFGINAATGADFGGDDAQVSYIAIGAGGTPRSGAYDLDFFAWAPGTHVPTIGGGGDPLDCNGDGMVDINDVNCFCAAGDTDGANAALDAIGSINGDFDGNGTVEFQDFVILSNNFGNAGQYTDGDADWNGTVEFQDFVVLSNNFGMSGGGGVAAAVPEPSSLVLIVLGALALLSRYRK